MTNDQECARFNEVMKAEGLPLSSNMLYHDNEEYVIVRGIHGDPNTGFGFLLGIGLFATAKDVLRCSVDMHRRLMSVK